VRAVHTPVRTLDLARMSNVVAGVLMRRTSSPRHCWYRGDDTRATNRSSARMAIHRQSAPRTAFCVDFGAPK
jgi:hypothetical protein